MVIIHLIEFEREYEELNPNSMVRRPVASYVNGVFEYSQNESQQPRDQFNNGGFPRTNKDEQDEINLR